jgi:hypothetical protein
MNETRVYWLTSDEDTFEVDWLRYLFNDSTDHINIELDANKIPDTKDIVLVCNHVVPYRTVLDRLRQRGKKYVIVLLSDENLRDPCEWLHDPNCVAAIRNYLHPNFLSHPKVTVIGLGYKKEFVKNLIPYAERDFTWSFAGTPHGGRRDMVEIFKYIGTNKTHFCSGFNANDGLATKEYAETLSNSNFVLCPPGQDSMDSFRIYEALEAGCIPVTLKNSNQFKVYPSYWHGIFRGVENLPFVMEDSWEMCAEKIKNISTNEVISRRLECSKLWNNFKTTWKLKCKNIYKKLIVN